MPESVVGDITAFMVDRMYRSWDEDKKKSPTKWDDEEKEEGTKIEWKKSITR